MAALQDSLMGDLEDTCKDESFVPEEIQRYNGLMKEIEDAATNGWSEVPLCSDDSLKFEQFIARCSFLSAAIEKEIIVISKFIREKLQDPGSPNSDPIEYARAVLKLETDNPWKNAVDSCCDRAISLDAGKVRLLNLIATRIGSITQNLCPIVGCFVAAKLVVEAGGLQPLSEMPATDLLHLGTRIPGRIGHLGATDLFGSQPERLRKRVALLLVKACAVAADADYRKRSPEGMIGIVEVRRICRIIEFWGGFAVVREDECFRRGMRLLLRPRAVAGKFKRRGGGGRSSAASDIVAQELAAEFGNLALAGTSSETGDDSKMID